MPSWQQRLRLVDWTIRVADDDPDPDNKSSVDFDVPTRMAAIRFRADTPAEVLERQLVHELLHVRLGELEDLLNVAIADHASPAAELLRLWRRRTLESSIEALADALTGIPRAEWCSGGVWDHAFPPAAP